MTMWSSSFLINVPKTKNKVSALPANYCPHGKFILCWPTLTVQEQWSVTAQLPSTPGLMSVPQSRAMVGISPTPKRRTERWMETCHYFSYLNFLKTQDFRNFPYNSDISSEFMRQWQTMEFLMCRFCVLNCGVQAICMNETISWEPVRWACRVTQNKSCWFKSF